MARTQLQRVLVLTRLLVLRCQHRQVPLHILCVVAGAALEQEEVVRVKTDIEASILLHILCSPGAIRGVPLPLDLLPGHGQAVTDGLLLPHQCQCHQRLVRAQPGAEARVPQHVGAGPGLGSGSCLFVVVGL